VNRVNCEWTSTWTTAVVQHGMNLIFHDQIHISFEREGDGHIHNFIQIQKCFSRS